MYLERTGDLFQSGADSVGHGCNCQGRMGAGIAAVFKEKYPSMFDQYRAMCASRDFKPGDVFFYRSDDLWLPHVVNMATQADLVGASLHNIGSCCEKIVDNYVSWGIKKLALPCVGAGFGGLDWENVREILKDFFHYSPLEVRVYHNPRGRF